MTTKFKARLPYLAFVIIILILDRWTKALVLSRFELGDSIQVIDGLFDITYVRNNGIAFGILNSFGSPVQTVLLALFSTTAAVVVIIYSLRHPVEDRVLQLSLSLILGGAIGNLCDRLLYGYVVDFLEFHAGRYTWPTFNVADSAISIGVILLAIEIFRHETPRQA
ncbi:MAG TPA: signal peptidase II [Terriglobia bacterium]|nr:signal peptidase II [Terriglobia bacterium]